MTVRHGRPAPGAHLDQKAWERSLGGPPEAGPPSPPPPPVCSSIRPIMFLNSVSVRSRIWADSLIAVLCYT